MRIISGKFKGHPIEVSRAFKGRPTTDYARESLFNILTHQVDFEEIRVLDLFSGTGAFSLECFSRGTEQIVSVELNAKHVMGIKKMAEKFGAENMDVIKADAFLFAQQSPETFDLVFCDPPFDHPKLRHLPDLVLKGGLLAPDGLLIVEHPAEIKFDQHPQLQSHRNYGHVHFSFFRHSSS